MSALTFLLPALTAVLAALFAANVARRWLHNRRPYLLIWAIGITLFGLGSAAEATFRVVGWNPLLFRTYYLCGAILTAAWLGQGTIQLLGRRPWPQVSLIALLLLSLGGVYEVARAELEPAFMSAEIGDVRGLDGASAEDVIKQAGQIVATPNGRLMDVWARAVADRSGVDYRSVGAAPVRIPYGLQRDSAAIGAGRMLETLGIDLPPTVPDLGAALYLVEGELVRGSIDLLPATEFNGSAILRATSNARSITPLFNVYGTLGLAGGAIYSAWLFFRKQVLYHRMIGNVLIALGALAPALGGTFSKAGFSYAIQVSNLIGIVVIFLGFREATRSETGATNRVAANVTTKAAEAARQ